MPSVVLRPGQAERVLAGHPWIYEGAVLRLTQPSTDGQLVQVRDHRHRFLGVGFFNSKSKIRVRLLSNQGVEASQAFFESAIRQALALRQRRLPEASSFRVVNAEGDFLSGLLVDKYEDVLVVQTPSLGMDQRKDMIAEALRSVFAPRAIVERNDIASRRLEGLPDCSGMLRGSLEGGVKARLNGISFDVDLLGGHKTGLYLDQQCNYLGVAGFARGARVLDCFSFTGGFGLHAARAGAAHVVMVDQSEEAIAAAKKNAEANGSSQSCSFVVANVFDWLKSEAAPSTQEKAASRFDLVILDPPSFTRTRSNVPEALRGYKEINLRALKLLRPNGILATFCCSHHVDALTFQDAVLSAAYDARCVLRRIATYTQSPDHPIVPTIPETEYLKGYAFEIAR